MTIESDQSINLQSFVEAVSSISMDELFPVKLPILPLLVAPKIIDPLDAIDLNGLPIDNNKLHDMIRAKENFVLENIKFKRLKFTNSTNCTVQYVNPRPFDLQAELSKIKNHVHHQPIVEKNLLTPPVSQQKRPNMLKSVVKLRIPRDENASSNYIKLLDEIVFDLENDKNCFISMNQCLLLKHEFSKKLEYLYFQSKNVATKEEYASKVSFIIEHSLEFIHSAKWEDLTVDSLEQFVEFHSAILPLISILIDLYTDVNVNVYLKNEEFLLTIVEATKQLFGIIGEFISDREVASLLFHWIKNIIKLAENCNENILLGLFYASLRIFELQMVENNIFVYRINLKFLLEICKRYPLIAEQLAHEIISNERIIRNNSVLLVNNCAVGIFCHLTLSIATSFDRIEDCTNFTEKLFKLLIAKCFDPSAKESASSFKSVLESFINDSLPFVSDIANFPGSEYSLRLLIQFLNSHLGDAQSEFLSRSKCIEYIGTILGGLLLNCDRNLTNKEQTIHDFLSLCHSEGFSSLPFNCADFNVSLPKAASNVESTIVKQAALLKPLFQMSDYYLNVILAFLRDSNLALRSKSLKVISTLISKFPELATKNHIISAINCSISDDSPLVREACMELIGKFVCSNDIFNVIFYQIALSKISDPSIAVRRRVLKIISDNAMNLTDELTLENSIFCLIKHARIEKEPVHIKSITEITNFLIASVEMIKFHKRNNFQVIQNVLLNIANSLYAWSNDFISTFVCNSTNLPCFQAMLDCFMEYSIENTLSDDQLCLLAFLAKQAQVQFDTYQLQISNMIKQFSESSDQTVQLQHSLDILSSLLSSNGLRKSLQDELLKFAILFVVKYPENVAVSAMDCLVSICVRDQSISLLNDLLQKFLTHIQSDSSSTKSRALINVSNLLYFSFKKDIFKMEKIATIFESIYQSIQSSSDDFQRETQIVSYFRFFERLIICVPSLGAKIHSLISFMLQSERTLYENLLCLKMFVELIKNFETLEQKKTIKSPIRSVANDVTNDTGNTAYCTALIQNHLQSILNASMSGSIDIQRISVVLFEGLFSTGIVHPGELFPCVIGLCSSTCSFVREQSLRLFEKMQERHKSLLLNCNPLVTLLNVYKVSPLTVDISYFYSFFVQKKPGRNSFFKAVLSVFDFDTSNNKIYHSNPEENSFPFFLVRVLANLPFGKLDDLCYFLYNLNITCTILSDHFEGISDISNPLYKITLIYTFLVNELRNFLTEAYSVDTTKIDLYQEICSETPKAFDKLCSKTKKLLPFSQKYPTITAAIHESTENFLTQLEPFVEFEEKMVKSKKRKSQK